jgi:hypothetical protein
MKKNEIMPFAGKMNGARHHPVRQNKPDRKRQVWHFLSHILNLKMNERRLFGSGYQQEAGWVKEESEAGINMVKVCHTHMYERIIEGVKIFFNSCFISHLYC